MAIIRHEQYVPGSPVASGVIDGRYVVVVGFDNLNMTIFDTVSKTAASFSLSALSAAYSVTRAYDGCTCDDQAWFAITGTSSGGPFVMVRPNTDGSFGAWAPPSPIGPAKLLTLSDDLILVLPVNPGYCWTFQPSTLTWTQRLGVGTMQCSTQPVFDGTRYAYAFNSTTTYRIDTLAWGTASTVPGGSFNQHAQTVKVGDKAYTYRTATTLNVLDMTSPGFTTLTVGGNWREGLATDGQALYSVINNTISKFHLVTLQATIEEIGGTPILGPGGFYAQGISMHVIGGSGWAFVQQPTT